MTNKPFDRLVADCDLYAMFYKMFLIWDKINTRNSKAGSFLDFSLIDIIESLIDQVPVQQVHKKPTAGRINRFIKEVTALVAEHTDAPFHCKATCHTVYAKPDARYDKIYHAAISFYPGPEEFSFHYRVNTLGHTGFSFKEPVGKKEVTALYVETQGDKLLTEFNHEISTVQNLVRYNEFIKKLTTSKEFEHSDSLWNLVAMIDSMKRVTIEKNSEFPRAAMARTSP